MICINESKIFEEEYNPYKYLSAEAAGITLMSECILIADNYLNESVDILLEDSSVPNGYVKKTVGDKIKGFFKKLGEYIKKIIDKVKHFFSNHSTRMKNIDDYFKKENEIDEELDEIIEKYKDEYDEEKRKILNTTISLPIYDFDFYGFSTEYIYADIALKYIHNDIEENIDKIDFTNERNLGDAKRKLLEIIDKKYRDDLNNCKTFEELSAFLDIKKCKYKEKNLKHLISGIALIFNIDFFIYL